MTNSQKPITRFALFQRIEHIVLIISFTTLGLTGLPQKFPLSDISIFFVRLLGGIETIRVIHRAAATLFLLEAIYHIVYAGYQLYVRRRPAAMLPGPKDAVDAIQAFMFNLGLRKTHPKMGRYNFAEKAEYWAMVWGLGLMAVTGFMLWNPLATTQFLPGQFVPAAKIAHGGEAVLAVLAIILWHFYHVHLRRFNKSIFTGKMDRKDMLEEHALELEQIESGKIPPLPSAAEQRRRLTVFAPVAGVVTVAMLAAVYWFVSFESSAILTVPPGETAQVLVTQTPTITPTAAPTMTPAPTEPAAAGGDTGGGAAVNTWEGGLKDVFKKECGSCHGSGKLGGYGVLSYDDALKAVKPGDPDGSSLVEVQRGDHPKKFSDTELQTVIDWITAGAPQQ